MVVDWEMVRSPCLSTGTVLMGSSLFLRYSPVRRLEVTSWWGILALRANRTQVREGWENLSPINLIPPEAIFYSEVVSFKVV